VLRAGRPAGQGHHERNQVIQLERLGNYSYPGLTVQGCAGVQELIGACQDHHWRFAAAAQGPAFLDELQAVHIRHDRINEDHTRAMPTHLVECRLAANCALDFQTLAAQGAAQHAPDDSFSDHHQDQRLMWTTAGLLLQLGTDL
jgi:hypothetical protein